MKIGLILLMVSMGTIYASAYSQNRDITLNASNASLKEVIKQIERQSDFTFFYNEDYVDLSQVVSLKANKKDIAVVLNSLCSQAKLNCKFMENNLVVITSETQQKQLKVSGRVTDPSGEPLVGVTVSVKGTTRGSLTDASGNYSITITAKDKELVFSFIGMKKQEIVINGRSDINLVLETEANNLDEVIVVGYGTQKKVTITGSVASSKGEELKATPVSSVANTLVGRMPGLIAKNTSGEPGYDDSRLLIRGNNTLGDNSPLIVVDGISDRAGGFSRIDANDIESVTILKDASAAIYGSRAANGVILVTTKRGKEGKTSVSYTFDYGLKAPTILPHMLNSADYAIALNDITRLIDKNPVPMYTDAEIQKFRDGSDPINYPNVSQMKDALKPFSVQKRHNLTISGGTDKVKYFTSLGYQFEDNLYKNSISNYNQYNVRSNIDIQATKALKFNANLSLRQQDRNSPWMGAGEIFRNIVQGDPRQALSYPNGLLRAVTSGGYNPLTTVDGTTGYQHDKVTYINADLGFNLNLSTITEGLSLDGALAIDKSNDFYKGFNKAWTLYSLNNLTGEYIANQYGPTNAAVNENMNQNVGITANMRMSYNRTFNKVHNISTFVAYEQYESKYDYLRGQRQNYVSTAIDQLFAGDTKGQINDGSASESARQNYFGRVDYSYAEKYLLQFNWRYDGSENFPKANRFGFFPGVSLGWRASEEQFWKDNLSFIDYFKIRGSYGKMGNDRINYNGSDQHFTYLTNYTFGNNAILGGSNPVGYTGIVQVQTGNPNVTWEIATTYNLGFDAKFLNNAFTFGLDIFKQRRDNILAQAGAVVPLYAGLSLPAENVGSCESKGFEATLAYNKTFGAFRLNLGGNISYAKSNIVSFNEAAGTPAWQKKTGKPIGANWLMYEAIGIYRTAEDLVKYPGLGNADLGDLIFRNVNGDSVLDANDMVRLDKTETPEVIFGLNMGVAYKQFELNMLWQGATNVWSYVFYEAGSGGIGTPTQDYFDNRWTPETPNASGPRIYDREKTSVGKQNTYFLNDASYLRLKTIELSYTLPKSFVSKLNVSNCKLFVSGYNLITITGLKDVDPEATASNQNFAGWFNVQSKILNFGLNITF